MKTKLIGVVLIAAFFLGVGNAWASVVKVDYGSLYYYNTNDFGNLPTAQFSLVINGFSTYGFCVDTVNSISGGDYSYRFLDWTPDYLEAAWLMDTYATSQGEINTAGETVGIQSSIWSAVTNKNYAPTSDANGQLANYNSWFGSLPQVFDAETVSQLQSEYKILLPYLTDINDQEIFKQALIVKYSSVPVPGAALLLGSALIGMVGFRKKFKA